MCFYMYTAFWYAAFSRMVLQEQQYKTQGRLVIEAEKAAAYPASSVRFLFLLKFLFLFWRFLELLWRPVNNQSPLPPPPPSLPLDRKN